MEIVFLGTGTSQGVPVIACDCCVCASTDQKDKRLRTSILIKYQNQTIVIDSGPDFRQQMLRENIQDVNALLFTHEHKDHVAGLDDIRAFNFKHKRDMDVFAELRVQQALKNEFHYVFAEKKYPGIPQVNLHEITNQQFEAAGIEIIPIRGLHHKLPVFGFRILDFVYITDMNSISTEEKLKMMNASVLVINALRKEGHISHFTLSEAIEIAKEVKAEKVFFTHMSHLIGKHEELEKELPENMFLGYDGLKILL